MPRSIGVAHAAQRRRHVAQHQVGAPAQLFEQPPADSFVGEIANQGDNVGDLEFIHGQQVNSHNPPMPTHGRGGDLQPTPWPAAEIEHPAPTTKNTELAVNFAQL